MAEAAARTDRLDPRRRRGDGRGAPSRGARHQAVQERPAGGGLRRARAARAAVGQFGARAGTALEGRQRPTAQGALLPGRDGAAV